MRVRQRVIAGALAIGLVSAVAPTAAAAPAGGPESPTGPATAGRGVTITLVTGDRVVLSASGDVAGIRRAKGREKMRFASWADGDALYVVPADAEPLLRADRLDQRLFDVRGLARDDYHDAARNTVPLIVTYAGGAGRSAGAAVATAGARVTRDLRAVGGEAVTVQKGQAGAWWSAVAGGAAGAGSLRSGVEKVWLDGRRELALDRSVPRIGAPAAWQGGYTGRGVTVAVLDSGVDATHPDLTGKVSEARNFSTDPDATDQIGHGTHVASTIAGSGAASGGRYKGVAPDASLLSGKVCDGTGCWESDIVAGMHWAAADKRATVVNMSLGGTNTPETDPVEEAVESLTAEHGTLFVVSAGNTGSADHTVESPGSAEAALTVGAVDRSDRLAGFSSRGPRVDDDGLKPDITAPGVDIVAARAVGTELDTAVDDRYVRASGTSMAAPHVTGAVALLAQRHPDWTATRLKATVMGAATSGAGQPAYGYGAGRVDVARAIDQAVTTDPPSISYGRTSWPHTDDEPVARTVTYHNGGDASVTLDLTINAVGPGGSPAPAGMFVSSVDSVTVPAGGTAHVTITADTRVAGADGLYSGQLVATGGQVRVSTPLGVLKELPTYQLTVRHLDATGAPTSMFSNFVYGLDNHEDDIHRDEDGDGAVTLRLPRGRYGTMSYIFEQDGSRDSMVAGPSIDLTADTVVTLDARQGKPVVMTVPEPSARPVAEQIWYAHYNSDPYGPSAFGTNFAFFTQLSRLYTAQLGDPAPGDWVRGYITGQWAKPDGADGFADSPYLYAVGELTEGRLPTGLTRHYTPRDLATVRHRFHATGPEQSAERVVAVQFGASSFLPVSLPSERVEYYNAGAEVATTELYPTDGSSLYSAQARYWYRPGREYREEWNAGPFGPSFAEPYFEWEWVTRDGDTITAVVPLLGDRDGHPGWSSYESARVALYRDGRLVKETPRATDRFVVPEEPGAYRLEVSGTRSGGELSTEVSGVWTFRSGHVDADAPAKLPVQVVRFTPTLDERNAAPAGQRFEIPVTVRRQPGAPAASVKRIGMEISYDDGHTWQRAPLRKTGGGWAATVVHPDGAGFASLRANATDSAGNTVTQTILRAYRLA